MLSFLNLSAFLTSFYVVSRYFSLQRNIRKAVKTNLPYIVVPVYTATPLWYFCYSFILPVFQKLPTAWTDSWLAFLDPYWSWRLHHEPFARLGSDTIVIVSPGGLIFCTCDPNVIVEAANRRDDFCKPVESYVYLDLFGPSLITREGKSWRAHQRILAPTFTERNAELVWEESIVQAEQMLKSWLNIQSTESRCIPDIRADTMMLPFNVINKAGFGVDLPWSVESNLSSHKVTAGSADTAARGHQMTYREALHSVISHLFHIIIFPSWLLRIIPFEYARRLRIAHMESVAYLKELIKRKEEELRGSQTGPKRKYRSDLMSALVSTKLEHETKLASEALEDEEALTESAILANVFLMMIAGHETTATILLLTLVELAINLEWQHEVQKDLDETFGQRPTISWNLRNDIARLSGGTVGATINEILRLYPPANIIPKGTRAGSAQTMRSGPQEFTIPGNTALQILTVSTHHNPKFWRSYSASFEAKDDLGEFRPQRWSPETGLTSNDYRRPQVSEITQEGGILRSEVSTSLFRPYPGAFIPFSVGQRGCIGRRFAQVELLAVIAVIFRTYSLELDVRDVSADEVIDKMSPEERKVVYDRARAETRKVTQEGMRHHLTMQLKAGKLALRLVGRGEERFFDAYTRK